MSLHPSSLPSVPACLRACVPSCLRAFVPRLMASDHAGHQERPTQIPEAAKKARRVRERVRAFVCSGANPLEAGRLPGAGMRSRQSRGTFSHPVLFCPDNQRVTPRPEQSSRFRANRRCRRRRGRNAMTGLKLGRTAGQRSFPRGPARPPERTGVVSIRSAGATRTVPASTPLPRLRPVPPTPPPGRCNGLHRSSRPVRSATPW